MTRTKYSVKTRFLPVYKLAKKGREVGALRPDPPMNDVPFQSKKPQTTGYMKKTNQYPCYIKLIRPI